MTWSWLLFSLRGRVTRKTYWIYVIALVALIAGSLFLLPAWIGEFNATLVTGALFTLAVWPTLSIHIKRLHDLGSPGWLAPALLFGYAALVVVIPCAFLPGKPGDNRFGPAPSTAPNPRGKGDRYQPLLVAILLLLAFGTAFLGSYRIPSRSMLPTLQVGDFVLANRMAYDLPVPFTYLPLVRLSDPAPGDVVVFFHPTKAPVQYLGRIVAGPGDTLSYVNDQIELNGVPVPRTEIGGYVADGSNRQPADTRLVTEQLRDTRYRVLANSTATPFPSSCTVLSDGEVTIPSGHYFVMGDNRDDSNDSRCWGLLPREYVVGKVEMVWMNFDPEMSPMPLDWTRLGTIIE